VFGQGFTLLGKGAAEMTPLEEAKLNVARLVLFLMQTCPNEIAARIKTPCSWPPSDDWSGWKELDKLLDAVRAAT
jgi:hypothetical protein